MMKSQLTVKVSSKKTNRHVSPVLNRSQTLCLESKAGWMTTFTRAVDWVNTLVDDVREQSEGLSGRWTSTHLVTLNIQVEGPPAIGVVEHVTTTELNGSGLVLLGRYFERFAQRCESESRVPPLPGHRSAWTQPLKDAAARQILKVEWPMFDWMVIDSVTGECLPYSRSSQCAMEDE